ncbi:MAG: lipopolysaccharide biosynthesis protein [Planctomycetota bacterium]
MNDSKPTPPAFDASLDDRDLRGRTVRGGTFTMVGQAVKFVLGIASLSILGRLLSPDEFGLVAMVLTLTSLATRFKDFGLSLATVQRGEINHDQISTLFWINVAIGVAIALTVSALAPAVAWFYQEPSLTLLTVAIATSFVMSGLTIQHQALLQRSMRFGALAIIQITAVTSGIVAAVIAAWFGAGVWALVLQILVQAFIMMLGTWSASRWMPGRFRRGAGVRGMLAFGGHLSASNLMVYISRTLDNILIGRRWGDGPLGLYSKAYQLLLLPIQQINAPMSAVALPTLSRLQNDPKRFILYYERGLLFMTAIGMPAVVLLFVAADHAVLTVLGPQWTDAIEIFRLLAPAALIGTFNVATTWVYISLGHTNRQLRWAIIATPVTCAAFVIGLPWGPTGVALAYSINVVVMRIPGILYCYQGTPIRLRHLINALWMPALTSTIAGVAVWLVPDIPVNGLHVAWQFAADLLVFGAVYIVAWVTVPHGRRAIRELRELSRDLRPGASKS